MESEQTVQRNKREYVESLYVDLEQMVESGEEGDAWGDETLLQFYDLMVSELYPVKKDEPEWVFMFVQIFDWQFQSYHEGVCTIYNNLYELDTDNSITRLSDCLHRHGYMELSKWYDYGIFDYNLYPKLGYPAEYGIRMGEIDDWIGDNISVIWQVYLELLQGHKEEMLEAAANWVPDCGTEEEKAEKENTPAASGQQEKEPAFRFIINLVSDSDIKKYDTMSYLEASQIDEKLVSQMVETKSLRYIQTTEAFSKEALKFLDEKLFSYREDIGFRIYNLQDGDLQHFEDMVHVRKIRLDSMEDIACVGVLSRFDHLEELEMHLSGRKDYSFVNRLSPELKMLSLHVDFSQDDVTFGDASLYGMEWLLRFPDLQGFYIGNSTQHIEFLIRKDAVRELILHEMPCPSPEVLHMLNVQSVIVHQEHIQGLERLRQIDSLQEIELVKIADIKSLNFLEHMSALEKLTLRSLPELISLPHFPEGRKLSEFAVYDCEKLTDMSLINEAAQWWFVRQYSAGVGSNAEEY